MYISQNQILAREFLYIYIYTIFHYLVSSDRNSRAGLDAHKVLTVSCSIQLTGIDKFGERYFPSLSIASFHRRYKFKSKKGNGLF